MESDIEERASTGFGSDQTAVLRRVVMTVGALGYQIRDMPGADRGALKGIEADLVEIGQMLGMFSGETVERPSGRWPEGEGVDDAEAERRS